jgi:hypothetical protein
MVAEQVADDVRQDHDPDEQEEQPQHRRRQFSSGLIRARVGVKPCGEEVACMAMAVAGLRQHG